MIRVVLADDHALVRHGVRRILESNPTLEVVGEAADGEQVLAKVRAGGFDVLVLDLTMPGRSGIELLKAVKDIRPMLPVLVLTMHQEEQYAIRAIRAGAAGYLTKDSAPDLLVQAVQRVVGGRPFISAKVAEQMAYDLRADRGDQPHQTLSDREDEVFRLLVAGRSVSEIAARLSVSAKTVSTHKMRILEKMRMGSLAELVRYAVSRDLVPPAE